LFHENLPTEINETPVTTGLPEVLRPSYPGPVKQIQADTDMDAVAEWLAGFADSPKTLKAYRRESERFLLWITRLRPGATLKQLMLDDVQAYEAFLKAIPADWISKGKPARSHPDWRPFAGQLTKSSFRHAMMILKSMMAWLQAVGYASTNPFVIDRNRYRKPKTANLGMTRYLSKPAIDRVFEEIEWLPAIHPYEKREKTRISLAFCLYYDSALRLGEPIGANFGSIDHDSEGFWLYVVGKGDKEARVPLSPRSILALAKYTEAFGLDDTIAEDTPLLLAMRGKRRRATEATMGLAVGKILKTAARRTREAGEVEDAKALEAATPHWLRHSRISHLINGGANVNVVRQLARHEDLATTSKYSHAEAQALQQLVGAT